MPQLDIVSYLAQYFWAVAGFFVLYHLLVSGALTAIQQQLGARCRAISQESVPAFPLFLRSLFILELLD